MKCRRKKPYALKPGSQLARKRLAMILAWDALTWDDQRKFNSQADRVMGLIAEVKP